MFIPDRELIPLLRDALARGQRVRMTVNGRSMYPFIRDGDVVEIAPVPPEPALGTVVLARVSAERYPLHRLVARGEEGWLLRGDNVSAPDGVVSGADLLGVVTRVEHKGRRVRLALGRAGLWIAWLSRHGWLWRLTRGLRCPRRVVSAILRRL